MDDVFMLFSRNDGNKLLTAQSQIILTNQDAKTYGLMLSEADAAMLAKENQEQLFHTNRIEFGESITPQLIRTFVCSTYLTQENYAETIAALLALFYAIKEESCDSLSDQEILDFLFQLFETTCGGSVSLLQNSRELDELIRRQKGGHA